MHVFLLTFTLVCVLPTRHESSVHVALLWPLHPAQQRISSKVVEDGEFLVGRRDGQCGSSRSMSTIFIMGYGGIRHAGVQECSREGL